MTERELRQELDKLVAEYFAQLKEIGNIVWAKTKPVQPSRTYVSLYLSGIRGPSLPNRSYVDGIVHDSYPRETTLTINLFTEGAPTSDDPNIISSNENTAVNDLMGFVNFLNSVHVDHWRGRTGVVLKANEVKDLTSLTHGSSWAYRAYVEIKVGFTQNVAGHAGINFEGGIPLYPNGRPKYDADTGMPLYDNGQPMYDAGTGLPLHDNGQPMYDDEGKPVGSDGIRLPDDVPAPPPPPLPPPSINDDGTPFIPPFAPDSSGGGSQELADKVTGYFTDVEIEKNERGEI